MIGIVYAWISLLVAQICLSIHLCPVNRMQSRMSRSYSFFCKHSIVYYFNLPRNSRRIDMPLWAHQESSNMTQSNRIKSKKPSRHIRDHVTFQVDK
ncbi:hypothetical protein GGR51DRAFT_400766 [Nemania sp. FL0031]|nr:hypothetical protein GGR51DRAFT_400766 [Nemania sp. FL0031]